MFFFYVVRSNKLSLNISNTHYLIFKSAKRKLPAHDNVAIKGHIIDLVDKSSLLE